MVWRSMLSWPVVLRHLLMARAHVRVRCRDLCEDLWAPEVYGLLEARCAGAARAAGGCTPRIPNLENLIDDLKVISTGVLPAVPLAWEHAGTHKPCVDIALTPGEPEGCTPSRMLCLGTCRAAAAGTTLSRNCEGYRGCCRHAEPSTCEQARCVAAACRWAPADVGAAESAGVADFAHCAAQGAAALAARGGIPCYNCCTSQLCVCTHLMKCVALLPRCASSACDQDLVHASWVRAERPCAACAGRCLRSRTRSTPP